MRIDQFVTQKCSEGASKVRDRHSEDVDEEVVSYISGVKVVLRKPRENAQYKNILQ